MNGAIPLYQAVQEMRRLSAQGKPFAFTYMSYSYATAQSDGIKQVNKAVLRKVQDGNEELLPYFDIEAQQNRQCHQVLLMTFNNSNLILE
jgi:hypothetical protein